MAYGVPERIEGLIEVDGLGRCVRDAQGLRSIARAFHPVAPRCATSARCHQEEHRHDVSHCHRTRCERSARRVPQPPRRAASNRAGRAVADPLASDALRRLNDLFDLAGVRRAWLTTWLEYPWQLDESQEALGLTNRFVPHRAACPAARARAESGLSTTTGSRQVWRFIRRRSSGGSTAPPRCSCSVYGPARFAGIDDQIGQATITQDPGHPSRLHTASYAQALSTG